LKLGGRFDPWVDDCPLYYQSNNAPEKIDVLGSLFLSILSGHKRYAHITNLMSDRVNSKLLGMNKVVSDDSARRALHKIDEQKGVDWLEDHLFSCYAPLLKTPWILDVDVTVKPLYGHQEGAVMGYNPQKPGRPSHTYHTYMMGNLRMVLNVEVQAGNQSHSNDSLPGLVLLLKRFPDDSKPEFVRADIAWGTDNVMQEMEEINQRYLFKLRKSKNVKEIIYKHHCLGEWGYINKEWEAKEDVLQLQGWEKSRRVVIVRRRVSAEQIMGIEYKKEGQQSLAFIDGPEDIKAYEYSVLVTDLDEDLLSIFYHYRDRADCENNFDEMENQWGWGGYTTKNLKSGQLMARMIALIYNWWNLFVRLALPDKHHEAITSRPLLLSSVGRLIEHGRQKKLIITSTHGDITKLKKAYTRLVAFFNELKAVAPQLSLAECWNRILAKAMEKFKVKSGKSPPGELPLLC
jgi:DDE family transposase